MVSGLELFWGLFNNLAIFILMVASYGYLYRKIYLMKTYRQQLLKGLLFGFFAITCMNVKIPVAPGVIVDQRNAVVVLSGIFGGPLSAFISAVIASLYRAYLGGSGVFAGITGISLSAIAGIIIIKSRIKLNTVVHWGIASFLSTLFILPGFLFIGDFYQGWLLMRSMSLPYGSAAFLGIFLLSLLLLNEEKRIDYMKLVAESEKRFRKLFEDLIDISFHSDENGIITLVSPSIEKVLGYTREEFVGHNINDFFRSTKVTSIFFKEIKSRGFIENYESEIIKKDGSTAWLSTNAKIIMEPDGKSSRIEGLARDITFLKTSEEKNRILEEQLLHRSKMDTIGQLTSGIAHDFNNILSGIVSVAQLLKSPKRSIDEKSRNYVDKIILSARRGSELTKNLLAYGRKESKIYNDFDITTLVSEMEYILKRTLIKDIEIIVQLNAEDHIVRGDHFSLYNALLNLAINAAHSISGSGKISIVTENRIVDQKTCDESQFDIMPGKYLVLSLSDSGCGISPENIKHIFEPFFTTKKAVDGSGLGLAAVKRVVEDHQGFLEVESKPGVGSVFTLFFPILEY